MKNVNESFPASQENLTIIYPFVPKVTRTKKTVTNFLSFFLSFLPSFFFDTFYNLNFTFISADKAVKNIAFLVFMLFLTLSVIEHFGR